MRSFGSAAADQARTVIDPHFVSLTVSLGTESQEEATAVCESIGREPHWNADGSLTTLSQFSAFVVHPSTGERIYCHNLHAPLCSIIDDSPKAQRMRAVQTAPSGNYLGDGTRLNDEEHLLLKELMDQVTLQWQWHPGDVMILDNLLVGHGRNAFKGEREKSGGFTGLEKIRFC